MELTKDYLQEHLTYADGVLFWKKLPNKKGPRKVGDVAGCVHPLGYWLVGINGKRYYAHHIVWVMHHGYMPKMIDHINQDKSDNRIENLRECTKAQNMQNITKRVLNESGVKGVGWSSQLNKWRAYISHNMKYIHLGYFDDLSKAKSAVESKRKELHGEFAVN